VCVCVGVRLYGYSCQFAVYVYQCKFTVLAANGIMSRDVTYVGCHTSKKRWDRTGQGRRNKGGWGGGGGGGGGRGGWGGG